MKLVVLARAMVALAAAEDAAVVDEWGRDRQVLDAIDAQAKTMDGPTLLARTRSENLGFMDRYSAYCDNQVKMQFRDQAATNGLRREYSKAREWSLAYIKAFPGPANLPGAVQQEYIRLEQIRSGGKVLSDNR